jgi:hypothetical protein
LEGQRAEVTKHTSRDRNNFQIPIANLQTTPDSKKAGKAVNVVKAVNVAKAVNVGKL